MDRYHPNHEDKMIEISAIRCQHGTEIEDPDRPEMECTFCAEEIAYELPVICHDCEYLQAKHFTDDSKQWCMRQMMYVFDGNRKGAVNCSEKRPKDRERPEPPPRPEPERVTRGG